MKRAIILLLCVGFLIALATSCILQDEKAVDSTPLPSPTTQSTQAILTEDETEEQNSIDTPPEVMSYGPRVFGGYGADYEDFLYHRKAFSQSNNLVLAKKDDFVYYPCRGDLHRLNAATGEDDIIYLGFRDPEYADILDLDKLGITIYGEDSAANEYAYFCGVFSYDEDIYAVFGMEDGSGNYRFPILNVETEEPLAVLEQEPYTIANSKLFLEDGSVYDLESKKTYHVPVALGNIDELYFEHDFENFDEVMHNDDLLFYNDDYIMQVFFWRDRSKYLNEAQDYKSKLLVYDVDTLEIVKIIDLSAIGKGRPDLFMMIGDWMYFFDSSTSSVKGYNWTTEETNTILELDSGYTYIGYKEKKNCLILKYSNYSHEYVEDFPGANDQTYSEPCIGADEIGQAEQVFIEYYLDFGYVDILGSVKVSEPATEYMDEYICPDLARFNIEGNRIFCYTYSPDTEGDPSWYCWGVFNGYLTIGDKYPIIWE